MITISDALNDYLNSTTRLEGQYVRVEIKTKSGVVYNITDEDINGGSVKLDRKSVSGSTFDIGECYINYVTLSVIDKNNKYPDKLDNSDLSVYFGVKNTELGLDEEIQLGRFIIPADSTVRKITSLTITGDSVLCKLDKPLNGVSTSGTPYSLALWCCDMCGLELGMAEDEFNGLSNNSKYTFYVASESSLETYRDVIMYISQIMGGFATDTNDGKVVFRSYRSTNDTFNMNNDTVASSKLGDSAFQLDGIGIKFGDNILYASGDSSSDYLLELDSNPLFDSLTEDVVKVILGNIWSQVKDIQFRSFEFQYNGNPAIECGDLLVNADRSISSFITSATWVYHSKSTVTGVSMDKRLKTQSQSVKKASASSGSGGGSSSKLAVVKYVNTETYEITSMESKIVNMYFTLPANTAPLMTFAMIVNNSVSGLLKLRIVYDNVDMILKPMFSCNAGYQTLTFSKSFDPADTSMLHTLYIYATFTPNANSEIDSSSCSLVGMNGIEVNIIGSNVSDGKPEWTGRYEITEGIKLHTIGDDNIIINPFSISSSDVTLT